MNSAPNHSSDSEYGSDPSNTKSSSSTGRSPLPDCDTSPQPTLGKKTANSNHNFQNYAEGLTFFKILVPSMAAGAIIGKGGETIAQLQQETGTRIKMSKATDYFPGTAERVCIIYGATPEGILAVHDFIAQKVREKPDPGAKSQIDYDTKQPAERDKQVKILVPNSTAGMIIGKGGNYIKHVKEESGAYVQISQKAKDHTITERCITVIGELGQNRRACQLILHKIFEDPQSNSCPNLSYADVMGPVPNYNPTGSPFANMLAGAHPAHNGQAAPNGAAQMEMNPYNSAANLNQIFGNLRNTLRMSGFGEEATNEILAAMGTLASYGILGLGLGLGGLSMNVGYGSPVSGTTASVDSGYGNLHSTAPSSLNGGGASPGTGYGDGSSKSPLRFNGHHGQQPHPDSLEMGGYSAAYSVHEPQQLSPSHVPENPNAWGMGLQQQQPRNSGLPRWNGGRTAAGSAFGHGDALASSGGLGSGNPAERTQLSIEINENLVGALLGREGKNVSEIEAMCGTAIQVTKKKFSAGRRTVMITGLPAQIQMTQMVIQQRLAQAEEKRALQHAHQLGLGPVMVEGANGPRHSPQGPGQQPLALSPTSQFA